jgi:hypothetical protein
VIILAVGGIALLNKGQPDTHTATSAGAVAAPEVTVPHKASDGGGPLLTATGRNYLRTSLGYTFNSAPGPAQPGLASHASAGTTRGPDALRIPAGLARLGDQSALQACLSAVEADSGDTAAVVDYALFEGTPALIITLAGLDRVIVVGADCGKTGSGTDELARQ